MIGKTVIGRSFQGCLNYNLSKVEKGYGEILECNGVRDFNRRSMIHDFVFRTKANPNLSRCVWHTSLSFQDNLSSHQMLEVAKHWMKGMGLDQTQYVIISHSDTDHPHIHIVANRINDEGKTISDSNNWRRSETLCRELVKKYQLTPVPNERNESKIKRNKLLGRDLLKTDINRVIRKVLSQSKNFEEFALGMHQLGFNCLVKFNPDQSIRGVSFERDGIKIKASDIHKFLSARNLAQIIELNRAKISNQQKNAETRILGSKQYINTRSNNKLSRSLDTTEEDEKRKGKKDIGWGI
ncbi:MAG: relaxase/mobilization nuclease domain-containing protein [Cyclobacteriaceae bacterium]|nr:relaxase/mobilization nuclease domain-containing protein [Cyclobacteriaceae bacterium]